MGLLPQGAAENLTGLSQSPFLISGIKDFLCFSTPEAQRGNAGLAPLPSIPLASCCHFEILPGQAEGAAPQRLQQLPGNRCPCGFPWHLSDGIVAIKSRQCSGQSRDCTSAFMFKFMMELLQSGADEARKGMEPGICPGRSLGNAVPEALMPGFVSTLPRVCCGIFPVSVVEYSRFLLWNIPAVLCQIDIPRKGLCLGHVLHSSGEMWDLIFLPVPNSGHKLRFWKEDWAHGQGKDVPKGWFVSHGQLQMVNVVL